MSRSPPAWWSAGGRPPWYARLLAAGYGAAVAARRAAYRGGWLRRARVEVPVIVVGNLVVGGSGKTPLVIALVRRLQSQGWTPGVASRGYGRASRRPLDVAADSDPRQVGDEPLLIAQRTGAAVRVDADRVAAARALIAAGCDIVVCDDGLQHTALMRDIEIEVVDRLRGYGNGALLPAGPLREPLARAQRCDFRVTNLGAEAAASAGPGRWPMLVHAQTVWPLDGGRALTLADFAGQCVHAVAGIGEPERFFGTLRAAGIAVVPHPFPDHHPYTLADLDFGSPLPVLMTEKDAVKCADLVSGGHYAVRADALLPDAFWEALLARLPARTEAA